MFALLVQMNDDSSGKEHSTIKSKNIILATSIISALLFTALLASNHSLVSAVQNQTSMNSTQLSAASHDNAFTGNQSMSTAASTVSDPQQFKLAMRDLWMDHIVYTRLAIISFAGNLSDFNATAGRLLKNQEDIGNAVKPYYGDAAGNQLTSLLKDHIMIAVSILKDAKAGNTIAQSADEKNWTNNADQIATFLSNANPNWSKDDLRSMLDSHLKLTKEEAVARLIGDYAGDIAAFDEVHKQAMSMADMLADGIIKQFPDKFNATETSSETVTASATDNSTSSANSTSTSANTTATSTASNSYPITIGSLSILEVSPIETAISSATNNSTSSENSTSTSSVQSNATSTSTASDSLPFSVGPLRIFQVSPIK